MKGRTEEFNAAKLWYYEHAVQWRLPSQYPRYIYPFLNLILEYLY
jgi:hypothetical protein